MLGHGSEQCCHCDELLARLWRFVQVVNVEVSIDTLTGLPARLSCMFAARRGFSHDGGSQEPHLPLLIRELSLELARLGLLSGDVCASRRQGGREIHP
jgi:hypothetical protein